MSEKRRLPLSVSHGADETSIKAVFPAAGASLEWTLWRGLFVEAGVDYLQGISPNSPAPFIQAGAGWRF